MCVDLTELGLIVAVRAFSGDCSFVVFGRDLMAGMDDDLLSSASVLGRGRVVVVG